MGERERGYVLPASLFPTSEKAAVGVHFANPRPTPDAAPTPPLGDLASRRCKTSISGPRAVQHRPGFGTPGRHLRSVIPRATAREISEPPARARATRSCCSASDSPRRGGTTTDGYVSSRTGNRAFSVAREAEVGCSKGAEPYHSDRPASARKANSTWLVVDMGPASPCSC